jgi:capsular polysaccharide biosynthesis protein
LLKLCLGASVISLPFLDKVTAIMGAQSAELIQRAHDLVNAPKIFGIEIGFNLPAFIIALVITAILVIGLVGMILDLMLARFTRLVTFPE